jgi:glycosyltransferase involved in cell wall biosynthesis
VRILTVGNMYPPHHLGGYELTWRSAVEHLRRAGHEVGVLTTDFRAAEPDPAFPEDPAVRRELRWYWHDHDFPPISVRGRIALERHNGRVLDRQLRDLRPDIVNWWAMGGMSLSLIERVRRADLPSVGVVGDEWMLYSPKVDAWHRMVVRLRALGGAVGRLAGVPAGLDLGGVTWLFNSQATRDHAVRDSGFDLARAEIAHPGIDAGLFDPAPEREWKWRLLYVGRLDERKGVDAAIEVLAHLPGEATLTVLGSGDERYLGELRDLCARLGLQERVSFGLRPRHELPTAYAGADALLFPVRWAEPWGLVPLEAMAVGTPVVATGTGGSAEYLRHRENALVVGGQAGPTELAEAVRELASDPGLRERLRANGLDTAGQYTEQAYNDAIESALARAVA